MQLLDRSFDVSTTPVAPARLDLHAARGVEQFLFHEARLLDERRYDEWLALWREDGRYWVPRVADQPDPFEHISLCWEDRVLREVRARRLQHPRGWSQQPPTRIVHLVGSVSIDGTDAAGHLIVRSSQQVTEWRTELRQLAGVVFHKLAPTADGGWQIVLKRVNLVHSDDMFGPIEVFL